MGKLNVFNFATLDGYYKGPDDDISWHVHGEEEGQFSANSLKSDNILLFGRVTYEMMAGYWPTSMAAQNAPDVAKGMNKAEKIVVSKTLKKAEWQNTSIIKDHLTEAIKKLKKESQKDITVLGSGSIVTQLAEAGLIDQYLIMIDPVAIGEGTSLFKGIRHPLNLKLVSTQTFKSGVVLLVYENK